MAPFSLMLLVQNTPFLPSRSVPSTIKTWTAIAACPVGWQRQGLQSPGGYVYEGSVAVTTSRLHPGRPKRTGFFPDHHAACHHMASCANWPSSDRHGSYGPVPGQGGDGVLCAGRLHGIPPAPDNSPFRSRLSCGICRGVHGRYESRLLRIHDGDVISGRGEEWEAIDLHRDGCYRSIPASVQHPIGPSLTNERRRR